MDIGDLVKTREYSSKRTRKEPKRFPYGIYSWADHLNNFIRSRLKPLSCKKTAWNMARDIRGHPVSFSTFCSLFVSPHRLPSSLPLSFFVPLRHFGLKVKRQFDRFSGTLKRGKNTPIEETFHGGYVFLHGLKIRDN